MPEQSDSQPWQPSPSHSFCTQAGLAAKALLAGQGMHTHPALTAVMLKQSPAALACSAALNTGQAHPHQLPQQSQSRPRSQQPPEP